MRYEVEPPHLLSFSASQSRRDALQCDDVSIIHATGASHGFSDDLNLPCRIIPYLEASNGAPNRIVYALYALCEDGV
jgi:hypothetical protein